MNDSPLSVLVLNASLKHAGDDPSNTEEVATMVLDQMREHVDITVEDVRLADMNIPVGLKRDLGDGDEWPGIAQKIEAADIILFATPIWWGNRSSLMQRAIERMDAFDTAEERGKLLNKVAGIVITGSEDGAQAVMAGLMETLSFMNFTFPPQCCTYWVGEVGMDPKTDAERRRASNAVGEMAKKTGKNLVAAAKMLKRMPFEK